MTTGRNAPKPRAATLLLVGTGLVGGSFALAAKANGVFSRVVGADRRSDALDEALELGIIDARAADAGESRFDAACVAVPLGGIATCVQDASRKATLVFDVGSVKGPIIDALETPPDNYVPCHPIAGSEKHGPAAADAALFRDRTVVVTPTATTAAWAAAEVRRIWEAVGAGVETQTPDQHDQRFALLSHLPHLVAVAFMDVVGRAGSSAGAGSGFKDFTRIAAGDAEVWHDILHSNASHIRRYLDELIDDLRTLGDAAVEGGPSLHRRIEGASQLRRAFDEARRPPATPAQTQPTRADEIPVIAIDGPSGAGKGTVAAAVADRLGWRLLDSGALYRVVALVARRQGLDQGDGAALRNLIAELDVAFSARGVTVAGVDETLAIRDDAVGSAASMIAAIPEVRNALLATQRRFRKHPGLVADGRDMGTVVFPDAAAKIFLTASAESRAQRRLLQLREMRRLNEIRAGGRVSRRSQPVVPEFDALLRELEARDARDRERTVSPLVPAPDAHTVDTTAMTIDEVVSTVMAHVAKHVPQDGPRTISAQQQTRTATDQTR